jgi:hypothetical protein
MRPVTITNSLPAAVANSIALLQTTGGAANLVLNGALALAGVATLTAPAQVTLTSIANISGVNFTITGKDYRGQVISEVLVGPNATTVTSLNTYATITSIAADNVVPTNTSVGNAATGSSKVVPLDLYLTPFNVSLALEFAGTANATVQYTIDDIWVKTSLDALNWITDSTLTNISSFSSGTLIAGVTAVRFVNNSGTGVVTMRVVQSGIFG